MPVPATFPDYIADTIAANIGDFLGSAGISYDPAALALFAAMTTPPPAFLKAAYNAAIVSLKSAGLWTTKLDVLYKANVHTAQAANLNWLNPAAFNLTVGAGAPIFAPYLGYKGNGTSDYLSTGYNPSTNAVNLSLNNVCAFAHSGEELRLNASSIMGTVGTSSIYINPWNGTVNNASVGANNLGDNALSPYSSVGLFLVNRTNSSNYRFCQNGHLLGTTSTASVSVPNGVIRLLGSGGASPQFSPRLMNCAGMGASLTPTQESQLSSIMQAFDNAVSANINAYNNLGGFNVGGPNPNGSVISHFDDLGNMVDAHAGNWLQVGNKVYMYAETHRTGYAPGTAGTSSAGVGIYSNNLNAWGAWHFEGYAFDITQAPWPSRVTTQNGNYTGMYSPKVIPNAATGLYVLWFYNQLASSAVIYTFTGSSPTFGATPSTPGNASLVGAVTFPTTNPGAPSFYVEPNGVNAYCVYNDLNNSYAINVIALNSSFTALSGSPTSTGGTGEGCGIFESAGNAYVIFGQSGNAYSSGNTYYQKASSPLGSYGAQTQLNDATNATSCDGQYRDVAQITVNGITTNLLMIDQWWRPGGNGGRSNQGFANFYVAPLIIDASGNLKTFYANAGNSIPGAQLGPTPTTPTINPDQVSYGDVFRAYGDISSTVWRMQTFVPTRSTLTTFELPLARNNVSAQVGVANFVPTDGSLIAELVTLDGSKNPVSVLGTVTVAASNLEYAPQWTVLTFNISVTPGTEYGMRFRGTNTVGMFGTAISPANSFGNQPYTSGVERSSGNSGSTWTTEAGISFMFSTT